MSSHFNYEINEGKLRERLNQMELPLKEDSWLSFNDYAQGHPLNQKRNVIPSFQINLNRNLILPFVFGTVIIAFSFLLFNFVSIKKKPDVKVAQASKPKTQPASKPPVRKIVATRVVKNDSLTIDTKTVSAEPLKLPEATPTPTVNLAVNSNSISVSVPAGDYTSIVSGNVFISPNKASDVVGNFNAGKTFTALEETVYFIKVNSGNTSGYIMKSQLSKNGSAPPSRKKVKKAEVLQSNQTPFMTTSQEKEPELR